MPWLLFTGQMVTGLSKPLYHNEPFEFESDNETAEVEIELAIPGLKLPQHRNFGTNILFISSTK
jgi:hypothetical protein